MEAIKRLYGEIAYSLLGNITDQFRSVSFDKEDNELKLQIQLKEKDDFHDELIEDILGEFEALNGGNEQLSWEVVVSDEDAPTLIHQVFKAAESTSSH